MLRFCGTLEIGELVIGLLLELRHHLFKGEILFIGKLGFLPLPDIGRRAFPHAAFPVVARIICGFFDDFSIFRDLFQREADLDRKSVV